MIVLLRFLFIACAYTVLGGTDVPPTGMPTGEPSRTPTGQPSLIPTGQPSSVPTTIPSSEPSCYPTSQPSLTPTGQPTGIPTSSQSDKPTELPTEFPSPMPTTIPTEELTPEPTVTLGYPTAEPTVLPTAEPSFTGEPTSLEPTDSPSFEPTLAPTDSPSFEPTLAPTDSPSFAPTLAPTDSPSFAPTLAPTDSPSFAPTLAPTDSPSFAPTLEPTAVPTFAPSPLPTEAGETNPPSAEPTVEPTINEEAIFVDEFQDTLNNVTTVGDTSQFFSEVIFNCEYAQGANSLWESLVGNTLPSMSLFYTPIKVSFIYQNFSEPSPTEYYCSNETLATEIVTNVQSSTTNGNVQCDGAMWSNAICESGVNAFCVNCDDPCVDTPLPNVINPALYPCTGDVDVYRLFLVDYNQIVQPPATENITTVCDTTTCAVEVELSKDGVVYCGVYPDGVVPANVDSIINQYTNGITVGNSTTLTFTGLDPLTTYDFYCVNEAFTGATQSYADVLATASAQGTTTCCRNIDVALTESFVYEQQSLFGAYTLLLDSLPSENLTVTADAVFTNASGTFTFPMVPASVSFSSDSLVLSRLFSLTGAATASPGSLDLQLTYSGASAVEYATTFLSATVVSVLDVNTPPLVPQLSKVKFSDLGTRLIATFDSATDKGAITASLFACDLLFTFAGADLATCTWETTSMVTMQLGSLATVVIGDDFQLKGGCVRAACVSDNTTLCGLYETVPETNATVANADAPVSPIVQISMPSTVSICSPFTLDLTSSTGSGGRDFQNISITVSTAGSGSLTNITEFFETYVFNPAPAVPAGTLETGGYNFLVQICNFLQQCTSSSQTIAVIDDAIPTASIIGSSYREIYRDASLSLQSAASVTECDGTRTTNGLSYFWSAYRVASSTTLISTLVSTSASPANYRLGAFSLDVSTLYEIEVTVIDDSSGFSTTALTQVQVIPNVLQAVVSGGLSRSIATLGTVTISAADSYDKDVQGLTGAAAGLSYSWSCEQTAPVISGDCPYDFTSGTDGETVTLSADADTIGVTADILVIVSSSGRSSAQVVQVYTVTPDAPTVKILSDLSTAVNVNRKVVIEGSVLHNSTGTATWSYNAEANEALTDLAASSTFVDFVSDGSVSNKLTLRPGALTAGQTYVFTFTADLLNGATAFSTVNVVVNEGPTPGSFQVSPRIGTEIETTFTVFSSGWTDINLPLSYQYGFISSSGTLQTIRSPSESTFIETLLPRGVPDNNFTLSVVCVIFDSLESNTTTTDVVQVLSFDIDTIRRLEAAEEFKTQTVAVVSEETINKIRDEVLAANTADEYSEILAVGLEVLNDADCTQAPNCTLYNRDICTSVDNTCGPCLTGYLGNLGSSNTPCTTYEIAASGASTAGNTCADVTDCTGFETCVDSVCVLEPKQCVSNCSGFGTCSYVNAFDAEPVDSCMNGDATCRAICDCDAGAKGFFCAYTLEEHARYEYARYILSVALQNLTALQDISASTTNQYATYLEALSRIPDELSESTKEIVFGVLDLTFHESLEEDLPYYNVETCLNALSFLADDAFMNNTGANVRRRLDDHNEFTFVSILLQQYGALLIEGINEGEDAILYDLPEFTIIGEYLTQLNGIANSSAYVPPFFALSGVKADQFSIDVNQTYTALGTSVISLRAASYGDSHGEVLSNTLAIIIEDETYCADAGCNVSLILENPSSETYDPMTTTAPMRTGYCEFGVPEDLTFACPSGENATAYCNGTFEGIVTMTCPFFEEQPSCSVLDGIEIYTDACSTQSYTSLTTTCGCEAAIRLENPFGETATSSYRGIVFATTREDVLQLTDPSFSLYAPTSVPTETPLGSGPDYERYMPVFVVAMVLGVILIAGCLRVLQLYVFARPTEKIYAADGKNIKLEPVKDGVVKDGIITDYELEPVALENPDVFVTFCPDDTIEPQAEEELTEDQARAAFFYNNRFVVNENAEVTHAVATNSRPQSYASSEPVWSEATNSRPESLARSAAVWDEAKNNLDEEEERKGGDE